MWFTLILFLPLIVACVNDEEDRKNVEFLKTGSDVPGFELTDINGKREQFFIDLGDFCYGYPMFDLGMVYITCILDDDEFLQSAFHMNKPTAERFWKAFAPEYFGHNANLTEIEKEVRIYAGLKTLIIERDTKRPMPEFRAMLEGTIY